MSAKKPVKKAPAKKSVKKAPKAGAVLGNTEVPPGAPPVPKLETEGKVFLVDPDDCIIVQDPADPLFDVRGLLPPHPMALAPDPELVRTMAFYGNVTPIEVTRRADGLLYVTKGRQRVIAGREVKRKQIAAKQDPALTLKLRAVFARGDVEDFPLTAAVENLRVEETPLQKAERAKHLEALGHKPATIARALGVEIETLSTYRTLRAAPAEVKAQVAQGVVTSTAAIKQVRETRKAEAEGKAPPTPRPPKPPMQRNQIPVKRVREALISTRSRLSTPESASANTPAMGAMVSLLAVLVGELPIANAPAEIQWVFSHLESKPKGKPGRKPKAPKDAPAVPVLAAVPAVPVLT